MPWNASTFSAHNHGLTPAQSAHAARIANAVLRRSGDEGMAIAVANRDMKPHRDDGGMVPASPAPTPGLQPSNATQGPMAQSYIDRFNAMSPEQIQEMLPRLPAQIAGIAQSVLQRKRMMPQQASGGMVRRAGGGSAPFSNSMTPGQYTALPGVPGAFVGIVPNLQGPAPPPASMTPPPVGWPASTANGGPSLQTLFPQGGIKPAPPPPAAAPATTPDAQQVDPSYAQLAALGVGPNGNGGPAARGGGKGNTVPILAAGGEFVISPEHVARLGDGDVKEGHRRLDAWVVKKRAEIVAEMKRLKPPVKS